MRFAKFLEVHAGCLQTTVKVLAGAVLVVVDVI